MSARWIPAIAAYLRACRVTSRASPITAARSSNTGFGITVDRQVFRAREFERAIAFENQRDARFDAEHRRTDFGQQFHRGRANRGAIEAQVLPRLRRLG